MKPCSPLPSISPSGPTPPVPHTPPGRHTPPPSAEQPQQSPGRGPPQPVRPPVRPPPRSLRLPALGAADAAKKFVVSGSERKVAPEPPANGTESSETPPGQTPSTASLVAARFAHTLVQKPSAAAVAPEPPPMQEGDQNADGAAGEDALMPVPAAGPPAEPGPPSAVAPVVTTGAPPAAFLKVYVGTWNMHGKDPPELLDPWLPSAPTLDPAVGGNVAQGDESTGAGKAQAADQFDVYAIGTQEAERSIEKSILKPSKTKWIGKLSEAIGDGFVLVASHSLAAIHQAVFVRRGLLAEVRHVTSSHVSCGIANTLGNKGGVGVAMSVGATSFLFVNAHFAAHFHAVSERNADFHRIDNSLMLYPIHDPHSSSSAPSLHKSTSRSIADIRSSLAPASAASPAAPTGSADDGAPSPAAASPAVAGGAQADASPASEGSAYAFDRVIWCGDLNYRVAGNRTSVDALLAPPSDRARAADDWEGEEAHWDAMRAVLLRNDQLSQQRQQGHVFRGFEEGEIKFRPTYKFDSKARDAYDRSEKLRVPAYTDRVLYRASEDGAMQLLRYDCVDALKTSDHRPVYAEFRVAYQPLTSRERAQGNWRRAHRGFTAVQRMARSGTQSYGPVTDKPPKASPAESPGMGGVLKEAVRASKEGAPREKPPRSPGGKEPKEATTSALCAIM